VNDRFQNVPFKFNLHRYNEAGGMDVGVVAREGPKSKPDLVLVGHEENAEFALAVHRQSFHVASGGKDRQVLLWDIADHDGGSIWKSPGSKPAGGGSGNGSGAGLGARSGDFEGAPTLAPKIRFIGHEDTVEVGGLYTLNPVGPIA
jgi:hypothetical protein